MQTIEAQYEIVTPMFIGGAHQNDEPEIRPPLSKAHCVFGGELNNGAIVLNPMRVMPI
nr:hypothetical protein [Methylomarinum sp. Ch1-1]MDP4521429.1 hypothetical protein [Methylomarinum sp. Ch1-1]